MSKNIDFDKIISDASHLAIGQVIEHSQAEPTIPQEGLDPELKKLKDAYRPMMTYINTLVKEALIQYHNDLADE